MFRIRPTFEWTRVHAPSAILCAILLAACGGGSGGTDAPASPDAPPVSPFEPAPTPDDGVGNVPPGDVVDVTPGETPTGPTSPGEVPPDGASPDGDVPTDDDGTGSVDPTTPDDDGLALDAINAGNSVSLTEFAVQMNIVILTDRAFSPVIFLERFPGNDAAAFDPSIGGPEETVLAGGDCPLGGTYEVRGIGGDSLAQTRNRTYVECRTDAGTLSGTVRASRGNGGRFARDEYELVLVENADAEGSSRTVVNAVYDGGLDAQFAAVDFEVGDYSRESDRDPFSVTGSGTRRLDLETTVDLVFPARYDTETTIGIRTADGPIEIDVTTDAATLDREGLTAGTISLVATDGSRVDVVPGDSPGVVALTLTDSAGERFTDSVAWSDLYRPPAATVSP